MPLNPLVSAIVSAIVNSVGEEAMNPTPATPTMGIVRALPAESMPGEMQPPWQGQVQIDGKSYQLSPGAQIRNELNMIVMPTMVQAPVKVRYQTDIVGAVHRVWILSAAEAVLPENR
jgi:hypothetical protein